MTYTRAAFLILFLPIVIIIYNILPQKHRWKVLLISSYVFFWSISSKLIIYLLGATLITYIIGLWLKCVQHKRNELLKEAKKEEKKKIKHQYKTKQRKIIFIGAFILIGTLVVVKYSNFINSNINNLFELFNMSIRIAVPKFIMPIGISFYTLQAVSYIVDVYKEEVDADKNIGRLALFLSFFPQIMEGPICRYKQTAYELYEGKKTTYKSLTFGIQRIVFGLMKKFLIVDRINPAVIEIFSNYGQYDGGIMAAGMILYTLQLYMDFSGTMDIAIGTAEIFGVKLPENFRQPFFAKSVSEFWTRWHITLGAWFRDYIYYPVSLTKRCKNITSKMRKKIGKYYGPLTASAIALFCVWICNGLWHGAAWSYIFFGMYHFVMILTGRIIEPIGKKVNLKLHINEKNFIYKSLQIIRTTIFVFIGELFFRANGLKDGINMFVKMITQFSFTQLFDGTILKMNVDIYDYVVIGITVFVIFILSIFKEKGINIREKIASKNVIVRWAIYYALVLFIVIFGSYGIGVIPLDPMYANF